MKTTIKSKPSSLKTAKAAGSRQVNVGKPSAHVKIPLDTKNLLKMHISHAIMQGLLKMK